VDTTRAALTGYIRPADAAALIAAANHSTAGG
jgi:hypothetical protein